MLKSTMNQGSPPSENRLGYHPPISKKNFFKFLFKRLSQIVALYFLFLYCLLTFIMALHVVFIRATQWVKIIAICRRCTIYDDCHMTSNGPLNNFAAGFHDLFFQRKV